ncbi:hypothetical protein A2U01_0116174, partial [Trifolium medium]|nr:hypothetical protein [Trifolium medium]
SPPFARRAPSETSQKVSGFLARTGEIGQATSRLAS